MAGEPNSPSMQRRRHAKIDDYTRQNSAYRLSHIICKHTKRQHRHVQFFRNIGKMIKNANAFVSRTKAFAFFRLSISSKKSFI